jgi:hypothetical protein
MRMTDPKVLFRVGGDCSVEADEGQERGEGLDLARECLLDNPPFPK